MVHDVPGAGGSGDEGLRAPAQAPWRLDVLVTADADGRWVFRRDPDVTADLADVTWHGDDDIRYLAPEVVLAFKAHLRRRKDDDDLYATLPYLDATRRRWLAAAVRRLHPDHAWLTTLDDDPSPV